MRGSTGHRYLYGSSFVDLASGVRFEGHHPLERPDLWKVYLEEGEGKYRSRGFEGTLRRAELEDGKDVSLFFLGFSPDGDPVAGVRFHGPLESSDQAAVIEEMAQSSEIEDIRGQIDSYIRYGVLEVKGAWAKGAAVTGVRLIAAITRAGTHAMNWLGAEHAVAAVSDMLSEIGASAGARAMGTTWVPFPDERYRTIAVSWQRARTYEFASPEHQQAMRREAEQLARGPVRNDVTSIDDASPWTQSVRPLVLDVRRRDHREVLRVLREDSSMQLLDRFHEQREQLAGVIPPPPESLADGSRWVYYPWRRAAVRLLAPRSFATLRLDRNRNRLTSAEQSKVRRLRVGVVGLSAGHTIAHTLAMEGLVGELRLADFDSIDLSNLNRIPASVMDLGMNKSIVAARRIAEIDPYLPVSVEKAGVTRENLPHFLDGLDLVIEECDSLDMKVLVREMCRERHIAVIMETSDRGVLDVERFDLEPDRPVFHGLLGDMDSTRLAGLSTAQKAPFVMRIIGTREASSRGAASLLEVGQTITGWPQLGSEVTLGAATVCAAVRRYGLGAALPSGRVRFDVEEVLSQLGPIDLNLDALAQFNALAPEDPPLESEDPVELIVDAARRAPSGGNVQPWRFEANDEEMRIYMLPDRTSTMDVAHRATYVGVGAALFNARVQAASLKRLGTIKLFPEGRASHHVATLRFGEGADSSIASLRSNVFTRASNRRLSQPELIDDEVFRVLAHEVEREGAALRVVSERARLSEGAEILGASDRLRFLLPHVRHEMLSEIRWPGRDSLEEGLDVRTLEMDPASLGALDLVSRDDVMGHLADWRAGAVLGMRVKASVMLSSALAVVTVPHADPIWYVRGGAAMQRFWLGADRLGLALQPVSPLFLYARDEEELRTLSGERYLDEMHQLAGRFNEFWELGEGEAPVLVFRVFKALAPSVHSVRLPLSHVLSRANSAEEASWPLSVESA